jgi:hypothetical protein
VEIMSVVQILIQILLQLISAQEIGNVVPIAVAYTTGKEYTTGEGIAVQMKIYQYCHFQMAQ